MTVFEIKTFYLYFSDPQRNSTPFEKEINIFARMLANRKDAAGRVGGSAG